MAPLLRPRVRFARALPITMSGLLIGWETKAACSHNDCCTQYRRILLCTNGFDEIRMCSRAHWAGAGIPPAGDSTVQLYPESDRLPLAGMPGVGLAGALNGRQRRRYRRRDPPFYESWLQQGHQIR